ncbi:CU044_5270 family protein [Actinomadura sp. DC4]|uniref:CU044_5270 family protein n=1 Tax=Actinomadura sp. DC4 TaxID=3055069 RepID=UPI0025AFF692|nr:CU044_5270 family protein [Actinomadura sp. DC4]MDN3353962.1 CU044_5270 family protein [Actinomadura sp. DC4]
MDELELIKHRYERVAPPRPGVLDSGQARLLDAMNSPRRAPAGRRTVLRLAAVATAVVALVAGLSAVPDRDRGTAPAGSPAVRLAQRAETVARNEPLVTMGAHQWIYVRSMQRYTTSRPERRVVESWIRMDGRRSPANRLPLAVHGTVLAGMPEDPGAALTRIYAEVDRIRARPEPKGRVTEYAAGIMGVPRDTAVFDFVTRLLDAYPVTPRVQAALYGALSRLPGVGVLPDAQDAAGRHGIVLYIATSDDSRLELILDPRTYRYLGLRDVLTRGGAGEVIYWTARLSAQPVVRPGERP